ncbi:MAG: crossover junction endodeoxyribonuclease RuvC [Candidatus Omnitrophica bacterium]|nr:crossover junction endodeoxyribonuclease RuvC [Candidatus Omnitrophota bacterium]MDD5553577.1 crossover junction endodeoxyribonuclease RuvC [Candidatus Omnitrophota bacterium]
MRILGIDPALTITGYGAIDFKKNKLSLLEAGVITTRSSEEITVRLDKIYRGLAKLISDIKPDVMVLEKLYAHYRHPTTAYLLGQARGVICLACAKEKIPLVEYAATRIKKAIVGNGLASKQQVQRMVATILDLNALPKYTDVTDALALAIGYSYMARALR